MSNPLVDKPSALLDACVLWPASLRDTLLRLAETPQQYIPKWTERIWQEVLGNLESKRGLTPEQTAHLLKQVKEHFPEAFVTGYENLIDSMANDVKDRHVAAAAVKGHAEIIITFNLKDFPQIALWEWEIEAQHPDDFLIDQYHSDPATVISKLHVQAAQIHRSIDALLRTLRKGVPEFAAIIARKLNVDLHE